MTILIVAGLSLNNLKPRVWDPESPYYLPALRAVMVSFADIQRAGHRRKLAMEKGIHAALGIPPEIKVYLDNGAFCFTNNGGRTPRREYREFVEQAKPDWWPIPQDFIPTPKMTPEEQRDCLRRTMIVNRAYQRDGYVPVIHVSRLLEEYLAEVQANERLAAKPIIALGGLVPNLLRAPKAVPYAEILAGLCRVREVFHDKTIHVFGVGGTATLHMAALLGMDTVDSSGWRNRAARGLVQLLGRGDRMVAGLGKWRGRPPSTQEWGELEECPCRACQHHGLEGLKASGIDGFCCRATHNLWTLLEEERLVGEHLADGSYSDWYSRHLENSTYKPLIGQLLTLPQGTRQLGAPVAEPAP